MADRPILFSAPMVRALLAGTKTQTRRVVKPALSGREWVEQRETGGFWRCADGEPTCYAGVWETHEYAQQYPIICPYGQPGDRLWVREAHWWFKDEHDPVIGYAPPKLTAEDVLYRADGDDGRRVWRPSIHMPRWASRITLEVTGVRVERLQDISEADAIAEGIERSGTFNWRNYLDHPYADFTSARRSYRSLWEQINGPGSWDENPWVWVVSFRRCDSASCAPAAPQLGAQGTADGAPAAEGNHEPASDLAVSGTAADQAGVAAGAQVDAGEEAVGGGHGVGPVGFDRWIVGQGSAGTGTGVDHG